MSGFIITESDPKFVVMKTEDLKEISEKLGDGYSCVLKDGVVVVDRDPWHGVEFAECVNGTDGEYTAGRIYPVYGVCREGGVYVDTMFDDKGDMDNGISINDAKPSTESAYVEQLKEKAKELYGGIRKGDVFDLSSFNLVGRFTNHIDEVEFSYRKTDDSFFGGGILLYRQGKWAKKIEPVEVELVRVIKCDGYDYDLIFRLNVKGGFNYLEAGKHLTKSLEDYLNVSQVGAVLI